ncbi:MAG: hypothetical protein AAGJ46_20770 [Planctomycetota bacterium]
MHYFLRLRCAAVFATFTAAWSSVASAAEIDGLNIPDDFAGHLVATQTIQTGYIDDLTPGQGFGEGSELNQLFVDPNVDDGFLKIGVTGNLDNYPFPDGPVHGFVFFFDTVAGGKSTLDEFVPGVDGERFLLPLLDARFDVGFEPDFALVINAVSPRGLPNSTFYVDLFDLSLVSKRYLGRGAVGSGTGLLIEGENPDGMMLALDNSNTAGVHGEEPGELDAGAASATSGMELSIPISYLSLAPGADLGVHAMITSHALYTASSLQRHAEGFSNQSLPPFPVGTLNGTYSRRDPDVLDFRTLEGDQFARVRIVPEPTTVSACGLSLMVACWRFRRPTV